MSHLAFLGAGNMAAAMVDGLIAARTAPASITCLGGAGRSAATLAARTGITLAPTVETLLTDADTLVVAFKPQHLAAADPRLAELTAGKLVISVLAGKRLARLAHVFPRARNLIWAMPNTPGQIGAGITGWCSLHPLTAPDRATVEKLLQALGQHVEVPESQMDALTAVSGCGPAYLFEFAAALRDAGVAAGLAPEVAQKLSVETLLGAARLLAHRNIEPEILRNQVTSPNGVTFAGLKKMEARDFRGLIKDTVLTAKARSEEMAKDS
jgi:pyrroline-5-carboxylate reductase